MLTKSGTWVKYDSDDSEYKHNLDPAAYYDTWMFVSTE